MEKDSWMIFEPCTSNMDEDQTTDYDVSNQQQVGQTIDNLSSYSNGNYSYQINAVSNNFTMNANQQLNVFPSSVNQSINQNSLSDQGIFTNNLDFNNPHAQNQWNYQYTVPSNQISMNNHLQQAPSTDLLQTAIIQNEIPMNCQLQNTIPLYTPCFGSPVPQQNHMNMVLPQSNIQSYNISYVPNQYATNTALSTGVPFISSNSNLQQNSTNNWTQNGNLFNYQLAASNTNWSFYQQDENTYPHTTPTFSDQNTTSNSDFLSCYESSQGQGHNVSMDSFTELGNNSQWSLDDIQPLTQNEFNDLWATHQIGSKSEQSFFQEMLFGNTTTSSDSSITNSFVNTCSNTAPSTSDESSILKVHTSNDDGGNKTFVLSKKNLENILNSEYIDPDTKMLFLDKIFSQKNCQVGGGGGGAVSPSSEEDTKKRKADQMSQDNQEEEAERKRNRERNEALYKAQNEDEKEGKISTLGPSSSHDQYYEKQAFENDCYSLESFSKAHGSVIRGYRFVPKKIEEDYTEAIHQARQPLLNLLEAEMKNRQAMKFVIKVKSKFLKIHPDTDTTEDVYLETRNEVVTCTSFQSIEDKLDDQLSLVNQDIENVLRKQSGLIYKEICSILCHIFLYRPIRGGSYIKLDKQLSYKRCFIQVMNKNDNFCFIWAVIIGVHNIPRDSARVVSNLKPYLHTINYANISFPITNDQGIQQFENQNNSEIAINVISYEKEGKDTFTFFPLRISKLENARHTINLLLIREGEKYHYVYITDTSRLLNRANSSHGHRVFPCLNCM